MVSQRHGLAFGLLVLSPALLWPGVSMWSPPVLPPALHDVKPMAQPAYGDGRWSPVPLENGPLAPIAWSTTLHPDTTHPHAVVHVVALDLTATQLEAVAGGSEPQSATPQAEGYARTGMIPEASRGALLAAFDGGWKTQHGHFGMKVDGVTLAPPRDGACTIASTGDGALRIAPWQELAPTETSLRFFRQAPACFYSHGVRHPGLAAPMTTNWGADAQGSPVIRRSAIGLDARAEILFVAVSEETTAPAMADAMHHAGAADVAELDINWSFPKFLVFRTNASGRMEAQSLFAGFAFEKDEYVNKPSPRDFFYITRR